MQHQCLPALASLDICSIISSWLRAITYLVVLLSLLLDHSLTLLGLQKSLVGALSSNIGLGHLTRSSLSLLLGNLPSLQVWHPICQQRILTATQGMRAYYQTLAAICDSICS